MAHPVGDRHLNLFYSYNQDSELIENNLTRAWIVTLRLLSAGVRARFLHGVLEDTGVPQGGAMFAEAEFALQSHVDRAMIARLPHRYVLALASDPYAAAEEHVPDSGEGYADWGGSVPDAWIINQAAGVCLLVEARIGANPLSSRQLQAHARDWLGLATPEELRERLIPRTWYDVAHALTLLLDQYAGGQLSLNHQEVALLGELLEFLSFYGYRPFTGVTFDALESPARLTLPRLLVGLKGGVWDLGELRPAPSFQLGIPGAQLGESTALDVRRLRPSPLTGL
jgi:hypothetical protein